MQIVPIFLFHEDPQRENSQYVHGHSVRTLIL